MLKTQPYSAGPRVREDPREIPRPAGESAGLRDDAREVWRVRSR
jgi:hypothetical protein